MKLKLNKSNILIIIFIILFLFSNLFFSKFGSKIEYGIKDFINELDNLNQEYSYLDLNESDLSIYFPVSPKIIKIKEEQILIFEFRFVKKANQQSKIIDKSGHNIGEFKNIEWGSKPHFYKKGNLIVQYNGNNAYIIKLLEDILGVQFAGETSDHNIN